MNLKSIFVSLALCASASVACAQSAEHKVVIDPQREAFDAYNYAQELRQQTPEMQQAMTAPRKAEADGRQYPLNPDGVYKYAGYNMEAGGKNAQNQSVAGIIRFNLAPEFQADSVAAIATLSPYSCWAGDAYYSFQPNRTAAGVYNSMDIVGYDPITWEQTSSKRVRLTNGQNGIPYLPTYDPKTGLTYAISLSNPFSGGNDYDLGIWNYQTGKLQRLCTLGTYDMYRGQYTAYKGLFGDGKDFYTLMSDTDKGNYLYKVDTRTGEQTLVGKLTVPHHPYSNQAFWYDAEEGAYYYDHFNLYEGTIFYKFDPNTVDANGEIQKQELVRPNTGYQNVFCIPAETARTPQPADLKATMNADHSVATISFTVPSQKTDGSALAAAEITLTVNDVPVSVTGAPGEKVSVDVNASDGLNIATVRINDSYALGTTFAGGYDAPNRVTEVDAALNAEGKVLITWTAPTTGRYTDFGGLYDGSDLTFKVVRDQDGHVVADGITATECIDNDAPEYINRYTYTIYGVSKGKTGEGVVTPAVIAGKYLQLPYETSFDTAEDFDLYDVWSDDPGSTSYITWNWNATSHLVYAIGSGNGLDDWFATPGVKVTTENVYAVEFDYGGGGQQLIVTTGAEATTESQSNVIFTTDVKAGEGTKHGIAYFVPEADGIYRIGFHAASFEKDYQVYVDNIRIYKSMSTLSPAAVTDFAYQNNAGELRGNLFFTLPEKNIKGGALTSLTKYEVYVNNKLQKTVETAQPGSAEDVEITGVKGYNDVSVIAYNAEGEGLKAGTKVFIGPDVPVAAPGMTCHWGTSTALAHQIKVAWEAPTKGVHGGYVNPADYKYNLYIYDANDKPELLQAELTDLNYTYTLRASGTSQSYVIFGVEVVNAEGKSAISRRGITQGGGYKLPLTENFVEGVHSNVWINYHVSGNVNWTFNFPADGAENGIYNDVVGSVSNDGFSMYLFNTADEVAEQSLSTPIIDFKDAQNPVVKVWLYHDVNASDDSYFSIRACTDGSYYEEITDHVAYNDNAGWQLHVFPLTAVKGKRAMIGLNARLGDFASKCFMDNIEICEASGSDIALSGIAYDAQKAAGETAEVKVTVSNLGGAEAKDYEVMVYVDDEMVFDELPEESLAIGAERVFTFQLPLTSVMTENGCIVSAEVSMDGDTNAANNTSTELDIYPATLDLPAPTAIAANGSAITWQAPEAKAGMVVTEDFENYRSFTIDGFNGWTTVDVDEQLTTSFIEYYNNYWPYYGEPFAYIIWDPKSNGNGNATMWTTPYGDKCLMNWGTYGMDKEGHNAKEGTVQEDWLISPEIVGGTELSFDAQATGCDNYGETVFVVLSSSTTRDMSAFTPYDQIKVGADHVVAWKHFSTTIPADAKYVALVAVQNGFGTMIDNLTYTRAINPQLQGYNVYLGLNRINSAVVVSPEYAAQKNGEYAVSAQYDLGESALTEAVTVSDIDGIIGVEAAPSDAPAYNLQGIKVGSSYRGIVIKNGKKIIK